MYKVNCPYWSYDIKAIPPKCPHMGILFDFIKAFRFHESDICIAGVPDLTNMPQVPLELEQPLNPASYPLCCGICKLLHSYRIYRPLPTPHEGV